MTWLAVIGLAAVLGSSVTPAAAASGSTWYLPWVADDYGHWFTRVQVQNNSAKAAAIDLAIYDASGERVATQSESNVPPYAWVIMDQRGLSGLQANKVYSAVVTGSGDLVATVVGYTENHAAVEYTGQSLSQARSEAFAPGVMDNYDGWNARVIVQNLDAKAASIHLSFGDGCPNRTAQVAARASAVFYTPDFCALSGTTTGVKAYTTTGQKVAVLLTQSNRNQAAAHIGTPEGHAGVSIPRVLSGYYGTSTTVMCAASAQSQLISIVYGTGQRDAVSVGPLQAAVFHTRDKVPADTVTTAVIRATADSEAAPGVSCYVVGTKSGVALTGTDYSWAYNPQDEGYPQTMSLGIAATTNGGPEAVKEVGARWYLNWAENRSPVPPDVEFVPMNGGSSSLYVMGSNEPNRGEQAAVCPQEYVPNWHQMEQTYSSKKLVSPGVAGVGSSTWCDVIESFIRPTGIVWLTHLRIAFFNSFRQYPRFEALGYHTLGSMTWGPARVDYMTTQFEDLANQWGIPELWLDEYDSWKAMTPKDLREALDWLATRPKVTRIAYYQDYMPNDTVPLVDSSGKLTAMGRAYWLYR